MPSGYSPRVLAVLTSLLPLVAAACAGTATAPPPPAAPPAQPTAVAATPPPPSPVALETVRTGLNGSISEGAFYIAVDEGYFQQQGITLEPEQFNSATQMVAVLGSGQLDVGGGAPSGGLYNAISRDIPVKIVSDRGHTRPGSAYEGLIVRKDLYDSGALRSPADLRGKKVVVASLGTTGEVALDRLVKPVGLTLADLELVPMGYPDTPQAFANGSVDGGLLVEPFITRIVSAGNGVVLARKDEFYPGHQGAVILYSPAFISDRPEVARRFLVAYLQGARLYNDAFVKSDPAAKRRVIDILVKNTTVKDPALYNSMPMPGIDPNGALNLESLDADQDWWVAAGYQQRKVNLDEVVDTSFIKAAVERLGPYQ
jgi:NitT/TauT family transport system substrate-binding protein